MVVVADHAPVHVRNDVGDGDAVLFHEPGGEAGGLVDRAGAVIAAIFAHFDADGAAVARAVVIGVFATFVGGQALVDGVVIDREMPADIADGVVTAFESAGFKHLGMRIGIAATGAVFRGVNGDVLRRHRPGIGA